MSPLARRARIDLRRLNRLLGHARMITGPFDEHVNLEIVRVRSLRICELGAGDGSLLLELAGLWSELGITGDAELIDLHYLLAEETRRAFAMLGWTATPVVVNARTWLAQSEEACDVILANLFLHHFRSNELGEMFRQIAARTDFFIACEPRRTAWATAASRCLGLLGCNAVTRHDAPLSIRAGFDGKELSALWPDPKNWILSEGPSGPFTHRFFARRAP